MKIKQYEIWIADLNPQMGTEAGKKRPVIIVQTDLLNKTLHPSTIICPITTNVQPSAQLLRVNLKGDIAGLISDSDIMIDQMRAVDNNRLIEKLGDLPPDLIAKVKQNLKIILQ